MRHTFLLQTIAFWMVIACGSGRISASEQIDEVIGDWHMVEASGAG